MLKRFKEKLARLSPEYKRYEVRSERKKQFRDQFEKNILYCSLVATPAPRMIQLERFAHVYTVIFPKASLYDDFPASCKKFLDCKIKANVLAILFTAMDDELAAEFRALN